MDSAATGAANPDRPTPPAPPKLTVRCGGQIRSADPADGELTIGRDPASSIHFNFSWMSRTHVRLRPEGATWVAIDSSRNGMFVDGVRHESVPIADRMTIKLGDADGFAVDLFVGDDTPDDFDDDAGDRSEETTSVEPVDPGIARAGAAVAARRRELELTQRGLARDKIINAGALIAFEKGRSWPHESTRTKLEQILQWPPGTISGIRQGAPAPDDEATQVISTSVASPLIAQTIQLALKSVDTAIEALPDPAAPEYYAAATGILADLRNLRAVATEAARNAPGAPALVIALGGVRRRYDDLMLKVAATPKASVGQRLFAARHRTNLTEEDAALAAGLSVNLIEAAEADQPLPPLAESAVAALLAELEAT
ncbi:FHA domain-containing protein [[Mycobacterium] wendilense]|uniref:FHA domain-containing protein n=1 Tax=[Mycobacterium] wendilense TaxID=3064284 RepID=A0ABN9NY87_9MYCO|nr:FHA domain-containing protein [Mycolicibacterium sp. MU0050]CAJ1582551.1 FHA domain-containing protein [Mycolicibacterium sp. MU0050]